MASGAGAGATEPRASASGLRQRISHPRNELERILLEPWRRIVQKIIRHAGVDVQALVKRYGQSRAADSRKRVGVIPGRRERQLLREQNAAGELARVGLAKSGADQVLVFSAFERLPDIIHAAPQIQLLPVVLEGSPAGASA